MTATGLRASALLCLSLSTGLIGTTPAHAARDDANKPLSISADKGGRLDVARQRTEWNGNVVLSRGSMLLKAERMDIQEGADGYYLAYAQGEAGKPVNFRQDRDVAGESIQGYADQLEYDGRSDTVRFIGNAVVRRMRGSVVADEVSGAVIVYDNRTEVFGVEGGQGALQPNGRVRLVMSPRGSASAPAPAASTPSLQLQPSPGLQPLRKTP
ncbi:lipopolysaccharide transport periplasmic protein LptA [Pelomonas sp. BJYL3]|uniref:lipopolysaccharide transport periplasmic protein LptA n=1 Tax=Pelomonas sp. BJYL3 TaxID=2976697 RepID=UPI0022B3E330|nr:lipopolysaccharide transport periplasmic protein LptA [Pelomonas sp. BJYL3]